MKQLKNKGFTLVELVAIIVILTTIFLVAVPTILNISKKAQNEKLKVIENVLCDAGKSYVYSNSNDYNLTNAGDQASLFISELVEYGIVESDIKNPINHESVNDDRLIIETNDDLSLSCRYQPTLKIEIPTSENACTNNLVYTGSEINLLKDKKEHVIYSVEKGTNAGTYTITANIQEGSIAVWKDGSLTEKTFTCEIAKADDSITIASTTQSYSGTTIEPTITTTSGIIANKTYYSDSECTIEVTPINVGEYYVMATTSGNGNYNSSSSTCVKASTINPLVVTTNVTCDASKIYDTTTSANCTIAMTNKKGNDDVSISGICSYNNANVGVDKIINCTDLAIAGTSISNYTLTGTTAATTGNIHNAMLTFNPNEGTLTGTSPLYVRKGQSTIFTGITNSVAGEIPTVSRTGYTFNGWYSQANVKIINPDKTVITNINGFVNTNGNWLLTSNQTLDAKWTANIYTIALNNQSATTAGSTAIYEKYNTGYYLGYANGAVSNYMTAGQNPITTPTKTGHSFDGYYTATSGGTQYIDANGKITGNASTTQFASDGSLFAHWVKGIYTITLDNQSATTAGTAAIYEKYDTGYYLGYANGAVSNYMTAGQNPITKPEKTGYTFNGYYTGENGSGVQYIDANGKITGSANTSQFSSNGILYAYWVDDTKPSPTITGGTTLKTATQTVTLKCSDGVGVTAYYFGTTNPTSVDSITTTTSLSSLTGSGLSQNLTASGTYYLACRDSAGNFEKTSITIRKYEVQNVLIKTTGTAGTYTSDNYATDGTSSTYYVKDGTSLTLASIYTTTAATGTFLGYTTAAPGETEATPSKTAPTVSNNTTKYYMWFNRSTFTVTLNAEVGGSLNGLRATYGGSVTAGSGGSNTIIVRYGEKITATATPQTGHSFNGFSGGYLSGTTNPQTGAAITEDKTITASWSVNKYIATFYSNLIMNSDFATATGWSNVSSGVGTLDTSVKNGSMNSMRISSSGSSWDGIVTSYQPNFKKNTKYKITLKAYRDSSSSYGDVTRDFRVYAPEVNSSNSTIDHHHGITINASNLPNKTWKEFSYTFTTTANGVAFANLRLDFNATSGTTNIWVSDVRLEEVVEREVTYNTAIGTLPTTTRSGYTSGGYYTGVNGTGTQVTASTKIGASNIAYYEKWTPNTLTVNYYSNGAVYNSSGTIVNDLLGTQTFTYDGAVGYQWPTDFHDPWGYKLVRAGYGGDGYLVGSASSSTKIAQDYITEQSGVSVMILATRLNFLSNLQSGNYTLSLYPSWVEKSYTIAINPNGGSWNSSTSTSSYTKKYSDAYGIANPTRAGYTFTGWSELSGAAYTNGLANVSVYNNASGGAVSVSSKSKSSDNPVATISNEYQVTNSGSVGSSPGLGGFYHGKTSQASHTYVHVFVAKLPSGYYFHNANNSIGTGGTTQWLTSNAGTGSWKTYAYKVTAGSSGTFSTFGHVYVSTDPRNVWSVRRAEQGSYTAYLAYSNIFDVTSNSNGIGQLDGSATLTAGWSVNTYTVTLNANGGSGGTSSVNITYGTTQGNYPPITKPTRSGFAFNGFWDTNAASGGTQWYNAAGNSLRTFNLTSNTIWYARWTAKTYTISYDANGGSGAPASHTYTYATSGTTNLASGTPSRDGYNFAGWALSSTATSAAYGAGIAWGLNNIPSDDSTWKLYAVWTKKPVTLTATFTAATGANDSSKYVVGSKVKFSCSGSTGNLPASMTVGGTTYTNSSNANPYVVEYTFSSPGSSQSVSATCYGKLGNSSSASSSSYNIYREFYISISKNGASSVGWTSKYWYDLTNKITVTMPSLTRVTLSNEAGGAARGFARSNVNGSAPYDASSNYSFCYGSGDYDNNCQLKGQSGNTASRTLYAITYSKFINPTKQSGGATGTNITSDAGYVYLYNTAVSSSTSVTLKNRCYSNTNGKKTFAYHAGGGTYNGGSICSASQSSCSKTITNAIFYSRYSFGCMAGTDVSTFVSF